MDRDISMIIGTLTLVGRQKIREYISDYVTHPLYIGWGMCTTANVASETDTSLIGELGRALATTSATGNPLEVSISETIKASYEILEMGIFTAASGGSMIYRGLFSKDGVTAKSRWINSGDSLEISIILNFANGAF